MSKCKLEVSHPKFRSISGTGAAFDAGVKELQAKVARGHAISGFFPQPMPGYPQYERKVWKWDFEPSGNKSYTRKGWRLFAYVADPDGPEPIVAQAFLAYDKNDDPGGKPAAYLAEALKEFLSTTIEVRATPDRFRRMPGPKDQIVSMCLECYETLFSNTEAEADDQEGAHVCP